MNFGPSPSVRMGVSASKPLPGLIVTLDALGTIYKFRKPFTTQYIEIAKRCGLEYPINEEELAKAFKASYKEISSEYPNYGKGQLESPRIWWEMLTKDTFRKVVNENHIPKNLHDELYEHFTSSQAYELYPDAKSFFSSMRELKSKWSKSHDPSVFVGVISNSDPRVKRVLQSLGLRVGCESLPRFTNFRERASTIMGDPNTAAKSPWYDAYNPLHDVDMLVTSYDAGYEKPDRTPFLLAEALAKMNYASKLEQDREDWTPGLDLVRFKMKIANEAGSFDRALCIHVGDDYCKDYVGAVNAGFDALHLAREGEATAVPDGTNVVTSLEAAALAIRVLAAQKFQGEDQDA